MGDRVKAYLDKVFAPYEGVKAVDDLKEELCHDLQEKQNDLKSEGYDEETAYNKAIESVGDVSELVGNITAKTTELQRQVGRDFSLSVLRDSDLKGVAAQEHKFNYSDLKGADFAGADLTGASFKCSALTNARFDGANLAGAKLTKSDLKSASFQGAVLDGTDFHYSSLAGVSFEGQRLRGTIFDYAGLKGTSFKNAVLENVSFRTEVRGAIFEGAVMDKLTYAMLKGLKADLRGVIVV